jgi:Bacteriophage peptidoglycan hydrolase.
MEKFIKLLEVLGVSKRETLYGYAKSQIGKKKSGIKAPKEYGCAEAVNRIFKECFGYEIGGDVSTARLYQVLLSGPRFTKIKAPNRALRGDIVISPTGYGSGAIANGHVGIFSDDGKIMSNNSYTGLWEENYDSYSWVKRYVLEGGYPMEVFRIIF